MPAMLRIDDRLVHGQVLFACAGRLRPGCIVLANETVASTPADCDLYRSLDDELEIVVETPAALLERLRRDLRTLHFVVVGNTRDARWLIEQGMRPENLHVGGLHAAPQTRRLLESVHLTKNDVDNLRAILAYGVEIEAREVPDVPGVRLDADTLARLWS
jgi:mannose/fructose/N-acetylgalactosamine-specific phosphotransferase system component IIB